MTALDFEYGGKEYTAKPAAFNDCAGCAFAEGAGCWFMAGEIPSCSAWGDGRLVTYIFVEKNDAAS